MARQSSPKLMLVVEGDDDMLLLRGHNTDELDLILGSGGKAAVIEAARLAEARSVLGIGFLVDRDYEWFTAPQVQLPSNVLTTHSHDLVMDIINSNNHLVERVIQIHSRAAARRGVPVDAPSWLAEAVSLAASIVPLRTANDRHLLALSLRDFPFGKLKETKPSLATFARLAVGRSKPSINQQDLVHLIECEIMILIEDDERLIGDHDFFAALARVMRSHDVVVGSNALVDSFLSTIDCAPLMRTITHQRVSDWAMSHNRVAFNCSVAA
ncbi:hypothetical protein [Clavibacter tessellarius]|uniref:hypothetical protein n=1 Tax=Clavibacter tessellarius TaxID=31965 RepID=UPI00324F6C09